MTLNLNRAPPLTWLFEIGILQLFHRNDDRIETTFHVQDLGCYLEGQGQSMTLLQNRVRLITSLFEVPF